MSEPEISKNTQTTADALLRALTEGKQAAIRQRKAVIQKEYMIARRLLEETYADLPPDDLPVDLQRLRRDLEITRDQKIADACDEVDTSYSIASAVIVSVADAHPVFYRAAVKLPDASVQGVPARVCRYLTAKDMTKIVQALAEAPEGLSLVAVCEKFGFATPPMHIAAKRFLGWLRTSGYVKRQGPNGKGMRYAATRTMSKLRDRMTTPEGGT